MGTVDVLVVSRACDKFVLVVWHCSLVVLTHFPFCYQSPEWNNCWLRIWPARVSVRFTPLACVLIFFSQYDSIDAAHCIVMFQKEVYPRSCQSVPVMLRRRFQVPSDVAHGFHPKHRLGAVYPHSHSVPDETTSIAVCHSARHTDCTNWKPFTL